MERIQTSAKVYVMHIEDLNISHRADLFDWLCSPEIQKGKSTERYWIVKTDTQIHNIHSDVDVFNLMKMLQELHIRQFQSLMILKHGINRPTDSQPSKAEETNREEELQQTNPPNSGEVSGGTPISEVPPSSVDSGSVSTEV